MAEFSIDRIAAANRRLRRYQFHLEYRPLLAYEGLIDREEQRQFVQFGLLEHFPTVEAYWQGEQGYGRYPGSERWLSFRDGPIADYLGLATEMLEEVPNLSVHEEGAFWLVEVVPERLPLRDNPDRFYRELLGEPADERSAAFLERMIEMSRRIEVRVSLRISREDNLIYSLTVRGGTLDAPVEMVIDFAPSDEPLPVPPPDVAALVVAEASLMMFLLPLPKSGWSENRCHGVWAQRTLDLIKERDAKNKAYTEIYDASWQVSAYTETDADTGPPDHVKHHPVVLGAVCEDWSKMPAFYGKWLASDPNYQANPTYYFGKDDYLRDHHHFGDGATGLEYEWYFELRAIESGISVPPTTQPGDRYYSARDWGFGGPRIDPKWNRLTFTEAIKQYNRGSLDGKRAAYLMLGHVVHLLQDTGHPDHARCVAHPGSGKSEPDIYKYYCPILAGMIAAIACAACWGLLCLICAPGAFGIAVGACLATVSGDEIGYEKLIGSKEWSLTRVNQAISKVSIPKKVNYDQLFAGLGKQAKSAPLQSVLGCGSLFLPPLPPIPGVDPDIDLDDAGQVKEYLQFTDQIVPQIIGSAAGLIQYFYEIVNYPPIVERVAIVQWAAGDTPRKFAFFADHKDHCLRYDARWVSAQNVRVLQQTKKQALSLDRPAYVFLQFGPAGTGPEKGKAMAKAELVLKGIDPETGLPIEDRVALTEAHDSDTGYYYWGSFMPRNCITDPYQLTLSITGEDRSAHLSTRNPSGSELDSNPATIATVDALQYPSYPLQAYTPGPDENHKILISQLQPPIVVATPPSVSVSRQAEVTVEIQQKTWDCHWEPTFGPITCPLTWQVQTRLRDVEQDTRQTGKLRLIITPRRDRCPPGTYHIKVDYTLGAFQGTLTIPVNVL